MIKLITKLRTYPIFTFFLLYGVAAGSISQFMGLWDPNYLFNPLGVEVSNVLYNHLLLPYWHATLNPIGYEYHNVIDMQTGKVIGQEKVPLFDLPVKSASDLYLPISASLWVLVGLGIELLRKLVRLT